MFLLRKKKKSNNKLLIAIAITVVLVLLLGYSVMTLRYVVWQLDDLGDVVVTIADDFNTTSPELKSEKLMVSIAIIDDIQTQLNRLSFFRVLPFFRGIYYDVRAVFDQTEQIFFNLYNLNSELVDVYFDNSIDKSITSYLLANNKVVVDDKIDSVSSSLSQISNNLEYLADSLSNLSDRFLLRQQRSNILELVDGIDQFAGVVDRFNKLIYVAPAILGYPEPVSYLLLLQNDHEMRATGGFIGNYGILKIDHGQVEDFFVDDVYHLDSQVIGELQVEPPAPIRKYLNVKYWYMRDSNWSPDFPTSAQQAIDFYKWEYGTEDIDGVIAMSPSLVSDFLEITGDLIVANVLYEPDNFTNILQYEVEQNYESRGATHWERKEVIDELANLLLQEFSTLPADKIFSVIDTVYNNLENKSLQIFTFDNDVQDYLRQRNWSGEIRESASDYLMVVDSNMAAYKTNQHIGREVNYYVQKIDNPVGRDYNIATVKIVYDHTGDFSWDTTRYRTYTRIYVPDKSVLIDWSGSMENDRTSEPGTVDIYQEQGKTVFGTFISIEPGHTEEFIFQYRLPEFESNSYEFVYQKQSGMDDQLKLNFFAKKNMSILVDSDIMLNP